MIVKRYNVFNLLTGANIPVNSLGEAVKLQNDIKRQILDLYKDGFVINEIYVNTENNSEMMFLYKGSQNKFKVMAKDFITKLSNMVSHL